jgi:nucleotide-binding universal stress UspA family protein
MLDQSGRIVVGYDGSESAGAAVDWAASEAERQGLPLTVLHVIDYTRVVPGPIRPQAWPEPTDEMIGQIADDGVARAQKHAVTVEVVPATELGHPAPLLIEASRQARLVVLGTRGHGPVAAAIVGSTAFAVSGQAHCPVVIVRGDSSHLPGPHRPVVVGVDDSPGADAALRHAAQVAAETHAPLIILSAHQPPPLLIWTRVVLSTAETQEYRELDSLLRTSADTVTAAAAGTAQELYPQLQISQQARQGSAAALIANADHRAGLLVVGARGRGGFAGLHLGSVGHRLIHSAGCPVAVVRGGL